MGISLHLMSPLDCKASLDTINTAASNAQLKQRLHNITKQKARQMHILPETLHSLNAKNYELFNMQWHKVTNSVHMFGE